MIQEVLSVPDNIPQGLLEKAECVIVIPSMTKMALGIGGSYGRGAMVCRAGKSFNEPWGAPAMYALEDTSLRPDNDANKDVGPPPGGRSAQGRAAQRIKNGRLGNCLWRRRCLDEDIAACHCLTHARHATRRTPLHIR